MKGSVKSMNCGSEKFVKERSSQWLDSNYNPTHHSLFGLLQLKERVFKLDGIICKLCYNFLVHTLHMNHYWPWFFVL